MHAHFIHATEIISMEKGYALVGLVFNSSEQDPDSRCILYFVVIEISLTLNEN